jgi:hypothetical protein
VSEYSIPLYGLTISFGGAETACFDGVLWQRHVSTQLTSRGVPAYFLTTQPDGAWVHHAYGVGETTHCEFAISPVGLTVISHSLPSVPQHDLFALFAEPVMRSVFRARRIISFHGAALERNGTAILVLGNKGTGKSTLAAILTQQGWSLMSDDLARVRQVGGKWVVCPGYRQLKLSRNTVDKLGLNADLLERRWSAPQAPSDSHANKYILPCKGGSEDVELRRVYVIGPRSAPQAPVRLERLPPIERVQLLVRHASDDPAFPEAPVSREAMEAAVSIAGAVDVLEVSMPDGISRSLDISAF